MQSKQPLSGLDGAHQMVSQGARKKKEKFGWFYRCLSVFIRGSQLNRSGLELCEDVENAEAHRPRPFKRPRLNVSLAGVQDSALRSNYRILSWRCFSLFVRSPVVFQGKVHLPR